MFEDQQQESIGTNGDFALDRLREANAEMQTADIGNSWIDASAFVKDFGNDHYEVIVWVRGAVLNHFETKLEEHGETRIYPHWLKSRGGKRATREDLAGENFSEQAIRYNTVSGDIQPR